MEPSYAERHRAELEGPLWGCFAIFAVPALIIAVAGFAIIRMVLT